MSVHAEPYQLRFLSGRFSTGSQELRTRAKRLEDIMNSLVQNSWKGEAAYAFALKCEAMIGDLQKAAGVLESAVDTLNRFAYRMERVNQLRYQANLLEQQSREYGGDSLDDLHRRQNLAREAAQLQQEAEWEANSADFQAAAEFQMMISMIPKLLEQMDQYLRGGSGSGELDDLPEPMRSYYLRHQDLLQENENETASTLTMGSSKQEDYEGIDQFAEAHAHDDETWYEETWDWLKGQGRGGWDSGSYQVCR